jgi:hypothetical protein
VRRRLVVAIALMLVVGFAVVGLVAVNRGGASGTFDRDATQACLVKAGFRVLWAGGSYETGPPGLEVGPVDHPTAELMFLPTPEDAEALMAPGEASVYGNVAIAGPDRDNPRIRSCLRER